MGISGFAGLGYQIVWTQQSALWLGHESAAVLAVVAAFFGGLAVGALALGARIERSARPARWYMACELLIGVWSLVLAVAMAPVSAWLLGLIGPQPSPGWQWAVAFCGTFVLLLPATAAMGATLPAMERVVGRLAPGSSIAALYAANTLGAVVGVLATAFWLVPAWGLIRSAAWCALLNGTCALLARGLPQAGDDAALAAAASASWPDRRRLQWQLGLTGLLGIGYEVLVVRVLSQVAENTVYTFAMLLAVYLVGTAWGAALYQRQLNGWLSAPAAEPHPEPGAGASSDNLRDRLLLALAGACLAGTVILQAADTIKPIVAVLTGGGLPGALLGEAALAVAAFLLPTIVMGAVFSHLGTQARAQGIGLGRSLGVNTLGAALAPLLFGVWLLPAIGTQLSLLLVVAGYLALVSPRTWLATAPNGGRRVAMAGLAIAGLAGAWAWIAPPLMFVEVPEGGHIASYREGVMAAVSVVEDAEGAARLRINNRQQEGSSVTVLADARQALLPLLLHPAPRRALFLGVGTGITASSAAQDAQLEVDAVELLPEVVEATTHFTGVFGPTPNPRLHLLVADARRFVRAGGAGYDLIVSDNFHPARSGSAALYTVEHFQAVRARLDAGGVFCQWLPLHQLDLATLRSIVRSFLMAYPHGSAVLATNSLETPVLGLVGRADDRHFDLNDVRQRLRGARLALAPKAVGLDDEFAVLGSFVADASSLARFAGAAPLNTDDRPIVAYLAPRITYAPDSLPRERLFALLHELRVAPDEVVDAHADAAWQSRLAAYWEARNRFIEAGRDVQPSSDPRRMLAQVRAPLLAVLRQSPDFRPAYDPLLRLAQAVGEVDAPAARDLLQELERIQPARGEARQALQSL
jgi:spermidine synthase